MIGKRNMLAVGREGFKARKNAVLKSRAEADEDFGEKVYGWIYNGLGYAKRQLKDELQVDVSLSTVQKFGHWWEARQAFARADEDAKEYEEEIRAKFPTASEQEIVSVCQRYFEEKVMKEGNPDRVKIFALLWLEAASSARKGEHEARKLDLEERKVAVLERKQKNGEKKEPKKRNLDDTLSEAALMRIAEQAKLL